MNTILANLRRLGRSSDLYFKGPKRRYTNGGNARGFPRLMMSIVFLLVVLVSILFLTSPRPKPSENKQQNNSNVVQHPGIPSHHSIATIAARRKKARIMLEQAGQAAPFSLDSIKPGEPIKLKYPVLWAGAIFSRSGASA